VTSTFTKNKGACHETVSPKSTDEFHATWDEGFYFHGECVNLAKADRNKAAAKPAADPASGPQTK
tara:strand:+ start:59593 stop:59787 length:195 start_codon:yes stop_codon:yes gene_type:complete